RKATEPSGIALVPARTSAPGRLAGKRPNRTLAAARLPGGEFIPTCRSPTDHGAAASQRARSSAAAWACALTAPSVRALSVDHDPSSRPLGADRATRKIAVEGSDANCASPERPPGFRDTTCRSNGAIICRARTPRAVVAGRTVRELSVYSVR